jgi:uncharacterized protein (TIGR02145 family)
MKRIVNKHLFSLYLLLFCFSVVFSACKKNTKKEVSKETGTVTDRQGNVYATIKIGDQWWMAENLRVRVYNDSTPIVEVKSTVPDSVWANKTVGAFCRIDNRYGLHYNWFAVSNSKKIAPAGWHIPSDHEWKLLEMQLGMSSPEADKTSWRGENESEKLIPESSTGWPASLVFGTNESGFCALPGGCRLFNGTAGEVAGTGFWWSSTESNASAAWYRNVSTAHKTIFRYYTDKNYGLTIRCVKD